MEIITSSSGNYSALLGTISQDYYLRCDGGAFVDTLFGADLTEVYQDGSFQAAIVAHKVELVIIYPMRQGYKARRHLTLGEFYCNELFQEIWFIPLKSWIYDNKTKQENPGKMRPQIVSHFLMRGHSMDEFSILIRPIEQEAFLDWEGNKAQLSTKYASAKDYIKTQISQTIVSQIYTTEIVKCDKGIKPYFHLTWNVRKPETELEQDAIEVAQIIGQKHTDLLIHEVTEKAAEKALMALAGSPSNQPALPQTA
ncbi:hypothetical protein [Coleofasciculus sp. E2-BRE-01]|jgi:hypothetical protein|uniref:hypothetical protein n=1 Tax=Coleofasciculus sp. E2-BRE-01 TaxID=3069524 RepID=UPI0032F9903A